jgi:hypothetical protein
MPRYRVRHEDLVRGEKIEKKEHPWASDRTARRIARNHLEEYGPGAYAAEKVTEKIVAAKTKQMGAKPIVKHRQPPPYDPMRDGLPREITRPVSSLFRF